MIWLLSIIYAAFACVLCTFTIQLCCRLHVCLICMDMLIEEYKRKIESRKKKIAVYPIVIVNAPRAEVVQGMEINPPTASFVATAEVKIV